MYIYIIYIYTYIYIYIYITHEITNNKLCNLPRQVFSILASTENLLLTLNCF